MSGAETAGNGRGRPGYSRGEIIAAAVREFTTHGYEATSMARVAKSLGITKSALYHHVKSKEEILDLTVNKALDSLDAVVESVCARNDDPGVKLRALVRGSVEVLCAEPESVALLLRLRGNSPAEIQAMARRRVLTRKTVGLIALAQDGGYVRHDFNQVLLGRVLYGLVNSISDWYTPAGRFSVDDIARVVESVLFEGIQAPGQGKSGE